MLDFTGSASRLLPGKLYSPSASTTLARRILAPDSARKFSYRHPAAVDRTPSKELAELAETAVKFLESSHPSLQAEDEQRAGACFLGKTLIESCLLAVLQRRKAVLRSCST